MQAADIAIGLRRRSPWEAMDLGLTMLQRWGRRVYGPHLLFAVPLMAAAFGLGWWLERAWVALLAIWWLKPAYDRLVLHVLSRAVFGEVTSAGGVLRAAKEWLNTGLFAALLLRFWPNTTRSFTLPVRQLEGLKGKAGRERRAVLGRRVGSYATWLTVTCLAIEVLVLASSFGMLTELFMPAKASEGLDFFQMVFGSGEGASYVGYDDVLAYGAALLVLEPFYVAAGFGLYLNRRTMLEGWDIEVALRRIAARHAVAALLVLGIGFFSIPADVHAQEKDPKKEIAEVLKAKEFGYYKDVKRWQSRSKPDESRSGLDLSWLRGVGYAIAKAGEVLLWLGAGALLAYALWWAARMLPRFRGPPPEPYRPPAALFGMDLAPETLPQDVGAAAAALAREGKLREALGLLYRGALSELVHKRGVQLLASHTEGEAVKLAKIPYFGALVDAWQQCAYARRLPRPDDVVRLANDYRGAFA